MLDINPCGTYGGGGGGGGGVCVGGGGGGKVRPRSTIYKKRPICKNKSQFIILYFTPLNDHLRCIMLN